MADAALRAVAVSVEFAGLHALAGVSLTLQPGEILGLIGPNGSGKTTLVNVLSGQIRPSAGQVLCQGEAIAGLPPRQIARRGVARTFQIVRLFHNLTVRENIEAAALAQGATRRAARAQADGLLAEYGLGPLAEALAGTLNHGAKRRVEIARALAATPRFLLLDEPAAGMNEEESEALLALLAVLPERRRLGLLVIDHDMHLIMRLCQRLQVLASGRTIAEGDVAAVRAHQAVVEAYLGAPAGAADA
jgi:branched-chain amino acid transport system ATP-binding protein